MGPKWHIERIDRANRSNEPSTRRKLRELSAALKIALK